MYTLLDLNIIDGMHRCISFTGDIADSPKTPPWFLALLSFSKIILQIYYHNIYYRCISAVLGR